jgi:hypothetical protein
MASLKVKVKPGVECALPIQPIQLVLMGLEAILVEAQEKKLYVDKLLCFKLKCFTLNYKIIIQLVMVNTLSVNICEFWCR